MAADSSSILLAGSHFYDSLEQLIIETLIISHNVP